MSETRDWSELPMDVITVITRKLRDLPDFTRFRSVCKTWGSTPLSGCPPQFPWLLECLGAELFYAPVLEEEQRFYSLSSGEIGTIHVDESHWNKEYRGPFHGYLLLLHEQGESCGISLLNPLTKEEIPLPPIPLDFHWPVWTSTNRAKEVMVVNRDLFDPEKMGMLAYHHPDHKEWLSVDGIFKNCCYLNGMFFSTADRKDTEVYHATSKKLLYKIPPPASEIGYLNQWNLVCVYLVSSLEEILRLRWFADVAKVEESVFHIHRLDFHGVKEKENPSWVKVNDIGDQMIFLDELNGFSISAKLFAGFQGNCIYFIHPWFNKPQRYDIKAGTVETVPCPFEQCSWFVPSLQ